MNSLIFPTLPSLPLLAVSGRTPTNLTDLTITRRPLGDVGELSGEHIEVKLSLECIRDVFGPEGRLIEIHSAEDQELAVVVMKAAESMFTVGEPELSYWWSGLRDDDDDGVWIWAGSNTPMTYSDWHPAAVPDVEDFNCMQFLSGTAYEGEIQLLLIIHILSEECRSVDDFPML